MGTLLVLVGKLFLVDLARLEAIWRILLFLGFGGLFLVLSYYFQARWKRSGKSADEFGDGESGRQQEPEEGEAGIWGCIGTIKALLGFRVKQFGRVLVPFAAGSAALGAPFLGRGQPMDAKGEPTGRKRGLQKGVVSSPKAVPVGLRVKARYFEVGKESDHERETLHRRANRLFYIGP